MALKKVTIRCTLGGTGGGKTKSHVFAVESEDLFGSGLEEAMVRKLAQAVAQPFPDSVKFTSATVTEWREKPMPKNPNAETVVYNLAPLTGGRPVDAATYEYAPTNVNLLIKHNAVGPRNGFSYLSGALGEADIKTGATGGTSLVGTFQDTTRVWGEFHTAYPDALKVAGIPKGGTVPVVRDVTSSTVAGVSKRKDTRNKRKKEIVGVESDAEAATVLQTARDLYEPVSSIVQWLVLRGATMAAPEAAAVVGVLAAIKAASDTGLLALPQGNG